jgi:hypothetical protein
MAKGVHRPFRVVLPDKSCGQRPTVQIVPRVSDEFDDNSSAPDKIRQFVNP